MKYGVLRTNIQILSIANCEGLSVVLEKVLCLLLVAISLVINVLLEYNSIGICILFYYGPDIFS